MYQYKYSIPGPVTRATPERLRDEQLTIQIYTDLWLLYQYITLITVCML